MAKPVHNTLQLTITHDALRVVVYRWAHDMRYTIIHDAPSGYKIRTGFTWWTWGELITIEHSGTQVVITSRCSPNVQLFDWGKNQGNVNMLSHFIALNEPQAN